MTKVIYLAHLSEGNTGWSTAAKNNIRSLHQVGVEVVPRDVQLGKNEEIDEDIQELMKQSSKGCDIVIQHLLPHHLQYSGYFRKNIAYVSTETDNIEYSSWPSYLNMMDQIWTPNLGGKYCLRKSNVKLSIKIVPHAIRLDDYFIDVEEFELPNLEGDFKFLFIGDLCRRKNLTALLKAFHTEFHPNEPVSLVIKASKSGTPNEECHNYISELTQKVKDALRIYPKAELYKREYLIIGKLPFEKLLSLYKTCDCLVNPSSGEAWGYPILEAMSQETPVITNAVGGPEEIVNQYNGYLVNNQSSPCFGEMDTFPNLFSGKENWQEVNICEFKRAMRDAYEQYKNPTRTWQDKCELAKNTVKDFSLERIGNLMKGLL